MGSFARPIRVLVADDNAVARTLARGLLVRLGCDVVAVASGAEVLEREATEAFDLVLLDLQMPDMDGPEVAAALRAQGHRGPILALTATVDADARRRCDEAGMNGVLEKPVGRDELASMLLSLGLGLGARAA